MDVRVRQGYIIDGYILEEMVGSGGFSTVYRARSLDPVPRYDTIIAVKVLHPRRLDRWQIRRFVKEMKISILLQHPNVVRVYAVRKQDRNYFGLIEFMDTDLLKAIRTKPHIFNQQNVISIIKKAALGLDYIHKNGIIHKDVNPSNVLVSYNLEKIKITDFGLAEKKGFLKKDNGSGGGTEGYIAPERLEGRSSDIKSDIYSFGKTIQKVYSELGFEIPESVKYVIETAIKPKKEERFFDMRELLYFFDGRK
jgi:eukaryotic-like serine/threonine-protein kinase